MRHNFLPIPHLILLEIQTVAKRQNTKINMEYISERSNTPELWEEPQLFVTLVQRQRRLRQNLAAYLESSCGIYSIKSWLSCVCFLNQLQICQRKCPRPAKIISKVPRANIPKINLHSISIIVSQVSCLSISTGKKKQWKGLENNNITIAKAAF